MKKMRMKFYRGPFVKMYSLKEQDEEWLLDRMDATEEQIEQFTERVAIMVESGVLQSLSRTMALRELDV